MTQDQDYALIIGIAHYPHLKSLQGPIEDARRVAHWLKGPGGLPWQNVKVIESLGLEHERPVIDEINKGFDEIFARAEAYNKERPRRPVRRLYVYFAGHGCSRERNHLALIMANADRRNLNRAMNSTEYRNALARRMFPEQIYLFDCCRKYDGRITGHGPDWTSDDTEEDVQGLTQVVMYAAGFRQAAHERSMRWSVRRGLFTQALMEGLEGAAATASGVITSAGLGAYVQRRLAVLAKSEKVRQCYTGDTQGEKQHLILASGVEPWRREVSVTLPIDASRIVVNDEHGDTVWTQVTAPGQTQAALHLTLGLYTIKVEPTGVSMTIDLLPDLDGNAYPLDLSGTYSCHG
ncbi:caspase family protein [Streptomyces djakartensis]|uniref:caspase family protein n=1 Tax=Streptomyces djakartensis TaxID=68193 RepID=UPI00167EB25D|nr:caspase family protein [Streptomyces djakartensis]